MKVEKILSMHGAPWINVSTNNFLFHLIFVQPGFRWTVNSSNMNFFGRIGLDQVTLKV